jgi:hypothetical protein
MHDAADMHAYASKQGNNRSAGPSAVGDWFRRTYPVCVSDPPQLLSHTLTCRGVVHRSDSGGAMTGSTKTVQSSPTLGQHPANNQTNT